MKFLKTHSDHELKRIKKTVKQILELQPEYAQLSDEQLKSKTKEFKQRLKEESLNDLLPEAYAAIREADKRVLGMEPFPVQVMGGIIMSQGRVAEMCTGEGKTLVCTLPAYLNALTGKGVHVVTVNDYLAKRDSDQMGQVYEWMGLSCGCITQDMEAPDRKIQYAKDITYITNNELGFDYLRDNMAVRKSQMVQRGLHFCIIDEVDSVLIDEARTPLIISGTKFCSKGKYLAFDRFAKMLERGETTELNKIDYISGEMGTDSGDYVADEKDNNLFLTEAGVAKIEKMFHIGNLSDPENLSIQHGMVNALRANALMHKDKDYVVRDDEVLLVDTFTGRIMPGRRFSDSLHQALEAKEGVSIRPENKTLATISFQNFFNKYERKCGMTGTGQTEEQEFRDIYGMDVIHIPTNRPIIRKDLNDSVYKTKAEKYAAIVKRVRKIHKKGQPILVGTETIEVSEILSEMLLKKGIAHNVLNAKNPEMEAAIVAKAGQFGAVTIATNMAGRGTDIKLDSRSKEAGGLYVIGTERSESRRVDNQLRGRSGRQGDPGVSKFFISLEDDLLRLFGSEKYISIFENLGIKDGMPIEHRMLSRSVEKAQKKVEENHFASRKSLLEYDQVNNDQREIIYRERLKVLNGEDIHSDILYMIDSIIDRKVIESYEGNEISAKLLNDNLLPIIPLPTIGDADTKEDDFVKSLHTSAKVLYQKKEALMEQAYPNEHMMREIERTLLLKTVDKYWQQQIDDMDQLRQGIHMVSYGQKDPKLEYRLQGFSMFNAMNDNIQEDTVQLLYQVAPVIHDN